MIERKLEQALEVTPWQHIAYEPDDELKEVETKLAADPENARLWMDKGLVLPRIHCTARRKSATPMPFLWHPLMASCTGTAPTVFFPSGVLRMPVPTL